MKQSKLFTKVDKKSKEYDSINATLLIKGGFISQQFAGVYNYLPLGLRVLNKIEKIVRTEMDKIASEVFMPSLSLLENWKITDRLDTVDVLFKATGANEISKKKSTNEYVIQGTHEETVTPLVQKFVNSYKDLPVAVYQIQTKFRNEARAKSGILRGREFRMKDLYSFHESLADLKIYYEIVKQVYLDVFKNLGFELGKDLFVAKASGGDFTKDFSHEFQIRIEKGEDQIYLVPSTGEAFNREVAPSKAIDPEIDTELFAREDVFGEGIIGVKELVKQLNVPINKTVKTLIYLSADNRIIVAAVRGDYEINELKLSKIIGDVALKLADKESVIKTTGAEIGYAGIIGLPDNVTLILDDSLENLTNFECGANQTNYHSKNINWGRDIVKPTEFFDIKLAMPGDFSPDTMEQYEVFAASEVGNIFPLETKFSKAFDFNYINSEGKQNLVYMGCFGMGTSRLMGVIAERFAKEKGLNWPHQISPFAIHLLTIANNKDNEAYKESQQIYEILENAGVEILWDDRIGSSAGEKFAESEIIGIPIRAIISSKSIDAGGVEVQNILENSTKIITFKDFLNQYV